MATAATLASTEKEWTDQVLDAARIFRWRTAHFRPARTAHGWRTPVQGDGAGFPDLILVRGSRGIAAELKRDAKTEAAREKQVEPEQWAWLDAFQAAGFETYVWRPSDLDDVIRALR